MARREAARERDASPDLVKLPGGGDVMGGGDSFAAARAAQQARSARSACNSAFRVVTCALTMLRAGARPGTRRRSCPAGMQALACMRRMYSAATALVSPVLSGPECVRRDARRVDKRTQQQLAKRDDLAMRATAAQAAEEDKMAMFRKLVAQGPIAIPKRQP